MPHFRRKKHRPSRPSGKRPPHSPSSAPARHSPASKGRADEAEGILQLKGRFGFVLSEVPGTPDVFVEGPTLRLAMDGDRVAVRVKSHSQGGKKREGEIVRVVKRARDTVVGVFRTARGMPLLMPESGGDPVRISDMGGLSPQEENLAVARILQWPTTEDWALGKLTEILGARNNPAVDLKVLLRKYGYDEKFPADVEAEARDFGDEVPPEALKGRTTFFHAPVFTIDGADAKDFDDAVSLEPRPDGGWRLGVHIADVAHYVRPGSALDKEAVRRGTSVYLSGSVVPMLPFPLSDNLCSLRPDEVRLTLTCLMDLDKLGRVVSHKILESAIKSARRFTYDEVETVLRGEGKVHAPPDVLRDLKTMGRLALVLRETRYKRGSLDFDFPEPYVVVDDTGWPVDVRRRERGDSHRLIEEFMLLANETVAKAMEKFPFLYRIHPKPDSSKLETLEKTLKAVGVSIPPGFHDGKPAALQKVLAQAKSRPTESLVHTMVLRSLKQAVYSPDNAGHYGLASSHYTHFTSPIRRYPDLIVHRIVKENLNNALLPARQSQWEEILPNLTKNCSELERRAVDAEREFLDLKRVQVMEDRLGETFDGVVTGVTSFGFFVQLTAVFVEGLVHITNLKDDYYIYDEVRMSLRGRATGRSFRPGQPVKVRLAAANVLKKQLDFEWVKP